MGAFGERLKREREKRKITLEEVALATKIGTRYLRAIEDEKFDQLPGGIFNKGFVKAYARHLGLNTEQAAKDYETAFRATHPEELTPADPEADGRKIMEQRALRIQQERPRIKRLPWRMAAAALLVFAFALVVSGTYSRVIRKPADTAVAGSQRTGAVHENQPRVSQAEKITPNKRTAAPEEQPVSSIASTTNPVETDVNLAGTFRVAIHAREDSWIHINADGKDVLEDTLTAESEKSVQAANQLVIKAGNIGALDFWFNGQKLPVQGDLDQVKTVTFDSAGLVAPLAKTQAVAATVER